MRPCAAVPPQSRPTQNDVAVLLWRCVDVTGTAGTPSWEMRGQFTRARLVRAPRSNSPPPARARSGWHGVGVRMAWAQSVAARAKRTCLQPSYLVTLAHHCSARLRAFCCPLSLRVYRRGTSCPSARRVLGRFSGHDEPLGYHREASVLPTRTTGSARAPRGSDAPPPAPLRSHGRSQRLGAVPARRQRRASSFRR